MERSSVTRYLRIAVTALSLTACVPLIALWVRSYSRLDYIQGLRGNVGEFHIGSERGRVGCIWPTSPLSILNVERWQFGSESPDRTTFPGVLGFYYGDLVLGLSGIILPYWFIVLMPAATAISPWLPWSRRFSLRTLLIATTLVAVALGIVALSC
jgi:hypothetical protein